MGRITLTIGPRRRVVVCAAGVPRAELQRILPRNACAAAARLSAAAVGHHARDPRGKTVRPEIQNELLGSKVAKAVVRQDSIDVGVLPLAAGRSAGGTAGLFDGALTEPEVAKDGAHRGGGVGGDAALRAGDGRRHARADLVGVNPSALYSPWQ